MKVKLITIALLFATSLMGMENKTVRTDGDKHVLTDLWNQYEAAVKADLPQTQFQMLSSITEEASRRRLHWDFYDAASRKVEVGASRNWKLRDSLQKAFTKEVKDYDEPLVTYVWRRKSLGGDQSAFVLANKEALSGGRNDAFYGVSGVSSALYGQLGDLVRNDYEFALWSEFLTGNSGAEKELAKVLGDRYPEAAFLKYRHLIRFRTGFEREKALKAFSSEYAGKAIALLADATLLCDEKSSLDRNRKTSEVQYKDFYRRCQAFEKVRKGYTSGVDAKIAAGVKEVGALVEELESRWVQIDFQKDTALIQLRNLDKVEVRLLTDAKKPKTLLKRVLQNASGRFYVPDTLRLALPRRDDGTCVLEAWNGKEKASAVISSYSLAIASRNDADGLAVYVADTRTGQPLPKVDFELYRSGERVAKAKNVMLDGFTHLPAAITDKVEGDAIHMLVATVRGADGFLRRSEDLMFNPTDRWSGRRPDDASESFCRIFTDRGAYRPGETLRYKAVFYAGDARRSLHVAQEGTPVRVELLNAESQSVGVKELKTNDYGSVSGSFDLPEGARGGSFRICFTQGSRSWDRSVTVDEFVLPTFDLTFDPVDKLFFRGDEVEVTGRLTSYSGHPLSAARLRYQVESSRAGGSEGEVEPEADGRFSIRFRSQNEDTYYRVNVTVTDATGETHAFQTSVYITDRLYASVDLLNPADGEALDHDWNLMQVVGDQPARVRFAVRGSNWTEVPVDSQYTVLDPAGKVIASGKAGPGEEVSFDLPVSGRYVVRSVVSVKEKDGKEITAKEERILLKVSSSDTALHAKAQHVFALTEACADGLVETGGTIGLMAGTAGSPMWAVVDLLGDHGQLLEHRMVHLDGKSGQPGSLQTLSFTYAEHYPEAVRLLVFYFRDGSSHTFTRAFTRVKHTLDLPLTFSAFEDKARPGTAYSFRLKTLPGVEAVAAVFDKSSETIADNTWSPVRLYSVTADYVYVHAEPGGLHTGRPVRMVGSGRFRSNGKEEVVYEMLEEAPMAAPMAKMETANAALADDADALPENMASVTLRSDFASTLAFEPHLQSQADGTVQLDFRTADKLSTFIVQVFAHTRQMHNAALRQEMVVTLPVKVSVVEPGYLYQGDRYVLHATVSNNTEEAVGGTAVLQTYATADYEGAEPLKTVSRQVSVPAGGSVPVTFEVDPAAVGTLGLKVVFADAKGVWSDGVFLPVPVRPDRQVITEAHSAVWLAGMDKQALLRRLQASFTGTSGAGATVGEVDIRRMLLDAIPAKVDPDGKDLLTLSESYYVRRVTEKLGASAATTLSDEKLLASLLACRNADGGFGWFEGMRSSPVLTSILLERAAKLEALGFGIPGLDAASAVAYLDREQFVHDDRFPLWSGRLSYAQYAYVRSLYAGVPFAVSAETLSERSDLAKNLKDFKKYIKDYLVPSKKDGRGLKGQILSKSRRIKTLVHLVNDEGGSKLSSAWGLRFAAASEMNASLRADLASLLEYAVAHRDGGWYYPNAVMPWRGLLESELYAHSLLCDLLSDERVSGGNTACVKVSDGIRIWLMLQKETQHWETDPAYVDAIHSVMTGSDDVLATTVLHLTKTYEKPFGKIAAAGNGFTVERRFFRHATDGAGNDVVEPLSAGDVLHAGDRITAEYRIWNQENRSFVKLSAPREALFRPVDQLSGHYGWWLSPLRYTGAWSFTPQGYRDVKTDRTDYYFDVYPEEKTTVSEEFFVTQEGVFSAPVVTIESLYAPHYRANGKFTGKVVAE